jgi:hypothetical protein
MSYRSSLDVGALATILLSVPPCVADVTTSVAGSLNATGVAEVCFDNCFPTVIDPFSFTATNSQPVYNFSQTGRASASNGDFPLADASATLQQQVVLSTGHLSSFIQADDLVLSSGFEALATVDAENDNTVTFDSPGPFLLHVTGETEFNGFPSLRAGNSILMLTGPDGVIFKVCPFCRDSSIDESFTLPPGEYTLFESAFISDVQGAPGGDHSNSACLTLDADFAAVPEPRWITFLAAVLLTMLVYRYRNIGRRRNTTTTLH